MYLNQFQNRIFSKASGANRNKNLEDDVDDSDGIVMQEGGDAVTLLVQICYKMSMLSHCCLKTVLKKIVSFL